jgi:hypothetical protein
VSESPWQVFVDEMYERYGRRDPECFWCGERVRMVLQNFYSGGTWTTDEDAEGPCSYSTPEGARCERSPDGEHDVFTARFGALEGHEPEADAPETA